MYVQNFLNSTVQHINTVEYILKHTSVIRVYIFHLSTMIRNVFKNMLEMLTQKLVTVYERLHLSKQQLQN